MTTDPKALLIDRERLREKIASEPDIGDYPCSHVEDVLIGGLEDIVSVASSDEADRLSRCLETARATLAFAASARRRIDAIAQPRPVERKPYDMIVTRLLNPPFGTETSERLLMGTAADAIRTLLDEVAALAQPRTEQVEDEAVAWRFRIGAQNLWSYCDTEADTDFYIKRSAGRDVTKQPLYARPAPKPAGDVPAGWKLVPEQMTSAMWDAMASAYNSPVCWWSAALAASPAPANAAPASEREGA